MGKNAGRDFKRAQKMGGLQAGLVKADLDNANAVAHGLFGMGVGVLVQEAERARVKGRSLLEAWRSVRWWQVWRRPALIRAMKAARADYELWNGRYLEVVAEVGRLTPDKRAEYQLALARKQSPR